MSKKNEMPLSDIMIQVIKQLDKDNNLNDDEVLIMAGALESFTSMAVQKYLNGRKEHGGSLFDKPQVNGFVEAQKEFIDTFWYYTKVIVDSKKQMKDKQPN